MKNLILSSLLLLSLQTYAGFESPFPSKIPGVSIPNSDQVDKEGKVFRGMAPKKLMSELKALGITDVLIFKNQTKDEVDTEIYYLKKLGYQTSQITHIPFEWKDYTSLTKACEQTLDALQLLLKIQKSVDRKVFFHCTMGEDRTGHLAGLFRLLTEKISLEEVYENELCSHGFAEGNKEKPADIITLVNGDLKKLFLTLAQKIERGEVSAKNLDKKVCQNLISQTLPTHLSCQ